MGQGKRVANHLPLAAMPPKPLAPLPMQQPLCPTPVAVRPRSWLAPTGLSPRPTPAAGQQGDLFLTKEELIPILRQVEEAGYQPGIRRLHIAGLVTDGA